ncbi:MAG: hypothetical protein ACHQ1G_13025 [Planctomycetota bacterium]
MSPAELLRVYVERHTGGVHAGGFKGLRALFAEDASMRFHGILAGPFLGVEAILAAFATNPPDDELVILEQVGVEAVYAWGRDPEKPAGRLRITVVRGRISAIDVTTE